MDQQRKKKEIDDRRASSDDAASAEATAPLLESTQAHDEAMTLDDAQAHESMWQARAEEYLELAQRKEAELRNALRRGTAEREHAVSNAIEELIHDLFPALDALTQAASYAEKASQEGVGAGPVPARDGDESKLLEGVRNTLKLLQKGLSKHGIEPIAESGVPFDGHLHQALQVEEGEVEEETVTEVYAEGYRIGDRVLKPALVKVLKPL